MHAEAWIASHGRRLRSISVKRLRIALRRQPRECTWCGNETGEARWIWCSEECHGFYRARIASRPSVWVKCDGRCSQCGTTLDATTWEVHHIVPVAHGGGLCLIDNLTALCSACHGRQTAEQNAARSSVAMIRATFRQDALRQEAAPRQE